MKKVFLFAAVALVALASCTSEEMIEVTNPQDNSPSGESNAIVFASATQGVTRAGEFVGATAAEKLGKMFVVEGTKGTEQTNSPSTTVVFDNYLVGYDYNTAGTAKSNTNNWEYVGLQTGIDGSLSGSTWTSLHPSGTAQEQSIKFWDYSVAQYDFIAWSTGNCEAVTDAAASGKVKVTRINTGTTLSTTTGAAPLGGFTLSAANADDLLQCYYTDINTVVKANYGEPVTLTFRNMAAKVRVALYETVPGYSVKDVYFYTSDANPAAPADLGKANTDKQKDATLFTIGVGNELPRSGDVLVYYPRIGLAVKSLDPRPKDYNKASVIVTAGSSKSSTQGFGELTNQYRAAEGNEPSSDKFLGTTLPNATYAGDKTKNFYTAVIPNTNGKPLTLRVDYTLVSTDGSAENILVKGAKAVVPATYTKWLPNYAYTYIFKISDNSNGYTGAVENPKGLFPITFDAVVTSFVDANAEQATVTTVATPSITTYQQGHDPKAQDEYSKSQKAGKDQSTVKNLYVQVMDNNGGASHNTLKADLNETNKSLLFKITKGSDNYEASEAEVMDALQNRTNAYSAPSPKGRNGITLTTINNIDNTVTSIVNGVDDQPITVTDNTTAEIAIASLATGTYAYVYSTKVPDADEVVYNVASVSGSNASEKNADATNYYEVAPASLTLTSDTKAAANKVYFIENLDAENHSLSPRSFTFVQTKVNETVTTGLYEFTINTTDSKASSYTEGNFYFDVYNQNNGAYAVKVFKVVN